MVERRVQTRDFAQGTGVINAGKRERDDRHREMPLRVLRYFISACAISLALAWSEPAAAQRMKAGLLACDLSAGIGTLSILTRTSLACSRPDGSDRREDYDGSITKFGLDVGITGPGRIGLGSICRHGRWSRLPGRGLCRRECGSFACSGPWRERSDWEVKPNRRFAADLSQRTDRD